MQLFEDYWVPQLFCRIIQSAKQSKPPNHDLGRQKIHNIWTLNRECESQEPNHE
jgi:hypothetical protein